MTPYTIHPARIVDRRIEAEGIYTFVLKFVDAAVGKTYRFEPSQPHCSSQRHSTCSPHEWSSTASKPADFDHVRY